MSARFKIDSRGHLSPASPDAESSLAPRAGEYFVLPTAPDLLFLVRTPAKGGRIGTPRVVLAGDAAGFPLSDLMAFLSQFRFSGILRVHSPTGERSVSMKDGEVRGASSDDPADRLGEVLVRLGYVDRKGLEEALKDTPPSKVGRALVDRGLLQAHDLWKCLTHQVSEIFQSIVLCREGAFLLLEQELDDRQGHNLQLSTQNLLMDSIRKIDEMAHFRKRIPHGRIYVARKRPADEKLQSDEAQLLAMVTGSTTVQELGQAAKLAEFDVTKIVFRLLEGGYAMVSEKPPLGASGTAGQAPTAQPQGRAAILNAQEPQGIIQVFNNIFREIRDEVAKQGLEKEFVAAANAAITGEALSSSPVLLGLAFDAAGVLPEQRLLAQYEQSKEQLGSLPVAALKRALSDVMFFLLFQAGELLESRADEDLARRVKEILTSISD